MALRHFHPVTATWFEREFRSPTPPQIGGWESIANGEHTLIAAPTGSGKTLAAFLNAIDQLVKQGLEQELADETRVLYISPLKALSNDVQRNLRLPLTGISEELEKAGLPAVGIRTVVRTGDTPAYERTRMIKRPPHILVTTPESFYILLTSRSGRRMLSTVRTVIVDEIHAIVESKRGSHLALSLERLEALTQQPIQRIGLSATQRPIEMVAGFLVGHRTDENGAPRCRIVDTGHKRRMDLAIEVPSSPIEAVMAGEVWEELYDRLAELIKEHRTTLIFVNTRRLAERLARHLSSRVGEQFLTAHHGSLSRKQRFDAEQRLKGGQLKALVATASLELGIDIGDIDLVCQMGSVRRIATFLQRVGRSGHQVEAVPKGRLFPLSRDELVESVALFAAIRAEELDRLEVPTAPLDILAQQIVAEVAGDDWDSDELFQLFRRAWPYRELERGQFDHVLRMLGEGFSTRRGRRGAHLHVDMVNGQLRARRGARIAAMTSGGAIPANADYRVVKEPEGLFVGTLNEDFAIESMPGDIFQLGNTSWRILRIEQDTVRVEDARGEPPNLPFWLGEAPSRSRELSEWVSRVREELARRLVASNPLLNSYLDADGNALPGESDLLGPLNLDLEPLIAWLDDELSIPRAVAEQVVDYLTTAMVALKAMPSQNTLVLERFFDESGGMQLVVHSPFGSRINRAWGLSLRKRFCRSFNFELQAAATEDAIVLSLGATHSFPLDDVFQFLRSASVRETLVQALLDAPMFTTRWRWNANRSLAVLRFRSGKRVPPRFQRMDAEDLVSVVFPDQLACLENISGEREIPDHPLIQQTIEDCLHEAMDCDALVRLLQQIERGEKRLVSRDLRGPSPLAQEILSARPYAFLDDAPLEERRTMAVMSRRFLDIKSAAELGALDPEAITRVKREVWPLVRDADELHDALVLCGFLTAAEGLAGDSAGQGGGWQPLLFQLCQASRAAVLQVPECGTELWVAAERLAELWAVFPKAELSPPIAMPAQTAPVAPETALVELIRGRLESLGPVTLDELAHGTGLTVDRVEGAVLALESEGFVLQGRFRAAVGQVEWCERRLLARIHRYTISRLRKEIEPVSRGDLMRFLLSWQRVDPEQRGEGPDALAAVLAQLDGLEVPAALWEGHLLPARLKRYRADWLDQATLSGRFVWGRLSVPANAESTHRRGGPVKMTPIALLQRRNAASWNRLNELPQDRELPLSSAARRTLELLQTTGALFFDDLVERTRQLPTQMEQTLGELVFWGLVSADSFNGLRALLLPEKKRPTSGRRRYNRGAPRYSMANAGRWSLFKRRTEDAEEKEQWDETVARTLLLRYGVVFRRLLEREGRLPPWRDLLRVYRRLEARSEIRGGRFVAGFTGEQFALPEAVAQLRKVRRTVGGGKMTALSAADPLNLMGILTTGERVPAFVDNRILFRDGQAIAAIVSGEFRALIDLSPDEQVAARRQLQVRPASQLLEGQNSQI